jgi:hypothetical protein
MVSSKGYEEYFINETKMKKLYNMYLHQSLFDKILDILVLLAIIFTLVSLVMQFLMDVSPVVLSYIHHFSLIILIIFSFELFREYLRSTSKQKFLKKYWVDMVLVALLSLFFVTSYLGFARLRGILSLQGVLEELKEIKVLFNFFGK